ncbi:MAG: hypothetical protein FWC91_14140 [Defluviitaleaceae bacterium]|nr:hypothetical protein [Defluviitaleaceae bacterium]
MKKHLKRASALLLALVMTMAIFPPSVAHAASARELVMPYSASATIQPEEVELAIEALYYYGRLDENGLPVFDQVPSYVFYEFGHDLINDLIQTARRFDDLVLNGEIAFNEDLMIVNEYIAITPFNNRNRNAHVVTLFTDRFYMSRATTTSQIRFFRDAVVVLAAGGTMSALIPGLGKPAAAAFAINATSSQLKANRLQDRLDDSTSFGTILVLHALTIGMTFTTHVQ